jgi:aminobutyraldehyde dehydrogenase
VARRDAGRARGSLTGDVETGKTIVRTAAGNLKRVLLELGGKAPVVVFDDADAPAVAEGVRMAGYWNSGQDCTAASRVVAGPKIYDRLQGVRLRQGSLGLLAGGLHPDQACDGGNSISLR